MKTGLIVENKILVEIKAISEMDNRDFNQLLNYLNVFKIEVGLLLNFGTASLQYVPARPEIVKWIGESTIRRKK